MSIASIKQMTQADQSSLDWNVSDLKHLMPVSDAHLNAYPVVFFFKFKSS